MNNWKSLTSVQNKRLKTVQLTLYNWFFGLLIVNSDWIRHVQSYWKKTSLRFLILTSLLVVVQPNLIQIHPVRSNCPKLKQLDIWMCKVLFSLPVAIKKIASIKSALQPSLISACGASASCVDFPWSQSLARTIAFSGFNVVLCLTDLVSFELKIFCTIFFSSFS